MQNSRKLHILTAVYFGICTLIAKVTGAGDWTQSLIAGFALGGAFALLILAFIWLKALFKKIAKFPSKD